MRIPRSVQANADASSVEAIIALVGCSPTLEIHYRYDGRPRHVYAEYDLMNMTGSVKDRVAAHIVRVAYESGELHPGDRMVEASSRFLPPCFCLNGTSLAKFTRLAAVRRPEWPVFSLSRSRWPNHS